MTMNSIALPELYLPPVNRTMQVLDRNFFHKQINTAAATVIQARDIQRARRDLVTSKDALLVYGIKLVTDDKSSPGKKCVVLDPKVEAQDPQTWSPTLSDLVSSKIVEVKPFELILSYDDWSMSNILEAVLPDMAEDEKETPTGFSQVGHVAHLNLRDQYLPYKHLIAEVLLDKNPIIQTVINKTLTVGSESIFRTFPYEVLAGPDNLDVEVSESDCTFRFNFGKVYWNTRLGTEHGRIISMFNENEAVCDVMAGVGPFAIPAGKKKIWVRANDLNPESYKALVDAIQINKVGDFVHASNADGRDFIREATVQLKQSSRVVTERPKVKISRNISDDEKQEILRKVEENTKVLTEPKVFNHYVMNLPASAVEFLDAFKGLYHGREDEFEPMLNCKLPYIHVHTFQAKKETEDEEQKEVLEKVSHYLGHVVRLDDPELEVVLHDVRLVAPKKKMYCASFRLPSAVAFAAP